MEGFNYKASPTLSQFHLGDGFVRGAMGPIGSGKSVACCIEMFLKACGQEPNKDGKRMTRWAVIRNTYRELEDTTMNTFFDWFPKHLGNFRTMDSKFVLDVPHPDGDGTSVHMEVLFRALDRPNDVKKLLSLELTGAWINEAREIPKPILDMLQGRVGRYPSKRDVGPTWWGIIMDTNPCDEDHWWYHTFEEELPDEWQLFRQPSGKSAEAENIENLPDRYYDRMIPGKDQEWINVYVHGQYGFIQDGKVIFPEYVDHVHCVHDLGLNGYTTAIYLGADFGLTPACVFAQVANDGQVQIIDEIVTHDMGAVRFGKRIKSLFTQHYGGLELEGWGDPSGDIRSQTDETTPFQVLRAQDILLRPTYTNDFMIRREAVGNLLSELTMSGRPKLVISPRCRVLRKALAGGYKYRRMDVSGIEKYAEKPDKNHFSHVAEALQYLCLGLGYGRTVTSGKTRTDLPAKAIGHDYNPLEAA